MITQSLRRAALAVAVISALSIRATALANSDDAFASSLGKTSAGLATLAKLKGKPQQPAAASPKTPSAPDAVWKKVLQTVKSTGTYTPESGRMPGMFSIEDMSGDEKAAHTENMITIVGMLNDEGQFQAMGAMLISQSFTLDAKDGNWRIEQWLFQTNIYGDVMDAGHGIMIQTPDGEVLSATPERLNPSDPKVQTQYDAMLKHWAERPS